MIKTAFVYVVCGDNKHIETLNVSLQYLKKFSTSEIIVITDSSRNNITINHNIIIDIKTDERLNHHQASIYLKTSIHRYLNLNEYLYCYIDTDVLAISDDIDLIFKEKFDIIGFCPDNISIDYFSPYAMNCNCIDIYQKQKEQLDHSIHEYWKLHKQWEKETNTPEGKQLKQKLNNIKTQKLKNILSLISFTFQNTMPFLSTIHIGKYKQDKKNRAWYNSKGKKILFPIEKYENYVSCKTGYKYQAEGNYWSFLNSKFDVTKPRCTHLHEAIANLFALKINPENWQHPNGGVFLFNESSVKFLEHWHQITLEIFDKPAWKTRDQGTLASTIWKFNLQKNNLLPDKYNYIIDYFCDDIKYDTKRGFSKNNFKTAIHPKMIHVFHRFGDTNWDIWNTIKSFIEQ